MLWKEHPETNKLILR